MFRVSHKGDGIGISLACSICHRSFASVSAAWLAFSAPNGQSTAGVWVHKTCLDGKIESLFGVPTVTLMSGKATLERLSTTLKWTDE